VRAHLCGEKNHGISICQMVPLAMKEVFLARRQSEKKGPSSQVKGKSNDPQPLDSQVAIGVVEGAENAASTLRGGDRESQGNRGSSQGDNNTPSSSTIPCRNNRQATLDATWQPGRRAILDSTIARFFYGCGISFNTVRSPLFREMIDEAVRYSGPYSIPSYEALRTKLLVHEKSNIEGSLAPIKRGWVTYGCSLISDGWSDVRSRPLQGILVSSRGRSFFVQAIDCSGNLKTASYICDIWADAVEWVGPQNVIQYISDAEPVNRAAGALLEERYPHITWAPCVAHGLNNLLKDIGKLDWVAPTLDAGRKVVMFITCHHFSHALYRTFSDRELLKYAETRFGYNFLMLERLYEVRNNLRQLVVSTQWIEWHTSQTVPGQFCTSTCLNNDFWNEVGHLLELIVPIIRVMHLADGDAPCIGKIYEGIDKMIEKIQDLEADADRLRVVKELCIARWEQYYVPLHAAAYVLDPEFQGKGQEFDREVMDGWDKILNKMFLDRTERRVIRTQLAYYRDMEGVFGWEDAQKDRFLVNGTTWWQDYGADTPALQRLAIRILSQGCSASPCERLWSSFGHIASKKRNRLGSMKANDLVFVHANLRLLTSINRKLPDNKFIGLSDPSSLPQPDEPRGEDMSSGSSHEHCDDYDVDSVDDVDQLLDVGDALM